MNNYITLDSKYYKTPVSSWVPSIIKPMTTRDAWDGSTDTTYGPSVHHEWQGLIRASVSPATGYGSITDLRTTISKKSSVTFIDHYGVTYSVDLSGPFKEHSFTNVWDASSNSIDISILLTEHL